MQALKVETSVLLVVDVQERLLGAVPEVASSRLLASTGLLLDAAKVLGVTVMATEQYPKGLGPTAKPLADRFAAMGVVPFEKLTFDALSEPKVARAVAARSPRTAIVVGMEAHICVFQTVRELVRRGYETYVVGDAVASRTEENRIAGLALAERAGAIVTVAEAVAFDWTSRAGTEAFKAISKLVR